MEGTVENGNKVLISPEEVITKLKDDGDFDKLRLRIIQKLKENEDLRNNIISTVKQSATLNRAGAESFKPRELSDAIHEEIGNQMMGQISEALWGVIRSSDGMKNEISETVECVYNRLLKPKVQESSPKRDSTAPVDVEAPNDCSLAICASELENRPSYGEPKETPGDSEHNNQAKTSEGEEKEGACPVIPNDEKHMKEKEDLDNQKVLSPSDDDPCVPPGFGDIVNGEQRCDGMDEDPDVPPGFG